MRKSGAWFKSLQRLMGVSVPVACLVLAAGIAQGAGTAGATTESAPAGTVNVKAFDQLVNDNCLKCHNSTDWAGGLAMDTMDLSHPGQDQEEWEKAVARLRGRLMPPAGQKQPAQDALDSFVHYLETSLDASETDHKVGHVPLQRLNRVEFAASVKDLIGVDVDPKQVLPTEIEVEGFSNIAGALNMSPSFMEQYLSAARKVAQTAVGAPVPKMDKLFFGGGGGGGGQAGFGSPAQITHRDGFPLGTRGGIQFTHVFLADGEYRFSILDGDSIDAGLYPRGMETSATMVILVDGAEVARRTIGGPEDLTLADRDGPKGREAIVSKVANIPAQIKAGEHTVTVTFIERSWAESNDSTGGGRMFSLGMPIIRDGIQVVGPFTPHGISTNQSRAKIFVCEPKGPSDERPCAERIARHLATEAFRRPITDDDVKWLMKFYETGRAEAGGFDSGVTELVTAVLSSPDFLFRAIYSPATPGESRPLSDLELASRLSFFLWNTVPDKELLDLASAKKLGDNAVLTAQVRRMIRDPRAKSLVENFALSWLNLGKLEQVEPLDPTFNVAMRQNFEQEIRLFLGSVILEHRSVMDLLNANWTFVNESLARQYGLQGVYGPQFRRVTLTDENRWGLLGKGAVHLRTSYADRTSPVLRGAWVLDRIVGTPPTPPPPNVNTDLSVHLGQKVTTVRSRLEVHRQNPTCKGCHGLIDPLGLALENFDVTGRWRDFDREANAPIDAKSELTSGQVIDGPKDLRRYLASHPDQFPTTVTKRLMMYALNREVEYYDMPEVRQIVRNAAAGNYTFDDLVIGVVNSDAFRRQGPDVKAKGPPTKVAAAGSATAAK